MLISPTGEIVAYIRTNFLAIQLNLFGSREVTDFDGAKMEERQLAARWRINFTPTLCFFPAMVAELQGKSGRDAEVWRLLGYWKPLLLLLAAVRDGLGMSCLPRYLCDKEPALIRAFNVPEEQCADLWILRHAHHRDNAGMRAFTDFMLSKLRKVL